MIIKKLQRRPDAGSGRFLGNEFALPLGLDQIPERFELLGIDQGGIEIDTRRSRIGNVNEHMLLFRIIVTVLAAVPFGLVEHFRQRQRRLDRVEHLAFVEYFEIGHRAAAEQIGDHSARTGFRDDARAQRIAGAVGGDDLDLGKFLAKFTQKFLAAIAADVEIEPPFFLRRGDCFIPVGLPRRLAIRRSE